ncbi:histidine phosphatase family protein [Pseudomonas boanensis]|uniref:histidine phosphatase family protein n=1 Tax=Metapseudomonas boanensis TaxID=2822138 RepID=UPI0035D3F1C9
MVRRRIFLMRHAEVDYFGDAEGVGDPPLTANGRQQVQRVAKFFEARKVNLDTVLATPYQRTQESAKIICQQLGIINEVQIVKDLGEIVAGADVLTSEQAIRDGLFVGRKRLSDEERFLGGETIGHFCDRVNTAMAGIRKKSGWQTLLIVGHGGVNTALLSYALSGDPRAYYPSLEQDYACLNIIDVGDHPDDQIVRLVNHQPDYYDATRRSTTLERFASDYIRDITAVRT